MLRLGLSATRGIEQASMPMELAGLEPATSWRGEREGLGSAVGGEESMSSRSSWKPGDSAAKTPMSHREAACERPPGSDDRRGCP